MLRRKETAVPRPAAPSSTSSELTYLEMAFARVPMFSACSVDELVRIAQVATVRDVSEGTDVIREGEPGEEFFVILRGGARISRGGSAVATLDAGDFFGELALVDPAPRNATVTATSPMQVVVLARDAFRTVLDEAPIREHVLAGMARRLHELDRMT